MLTIFQCLTTRFFFNLGKPYLYVYNSLMFNDKVFFNLGKPLFVCIQFLKGGDDNHGDFQKDIRDTMPQINKQVIMIMIDDDIIIVVITSSLSSFNYLILVPIFILQVNFLLPFMGFGFNYTWLSLHGHISFRF